MFRTRRRHRKTYAESEMAGLGEFLSGRIPTESGCRYWVFGERLVLSGGSYDLLYRMKDDTGSPVYILNMDHPIANLPVPEWRERALTAAENVGAELLPLSETAFRKACDETGTDRPRLIIREGYEAVFTLADRYFLSGYDRQETPPLYFLCELPGPASSVSEARESLKPQSVRNALSHGVEVKRQGDLFFIATPISDEDIKMDGGSPAGPHTTPLYGTAHTATRVSLLPNGVMLAKGIVRHLPSIIGQKREPDHADLALGPGWWLVARNTVPAAPSRLAGARIDNPISRGEVPFANPFQAYD